MGLSALGKSLFRKVVNLNFDNIIANQEKLAGCNLFQGYAFPNSDYEFSLQSNFGDVHK